MDIASLLIALLRASGIPGRYVHGTVEIPEDRFRNWAGGFSGIHAAAGFAASTGMSIERMGADGVIEGKRKRGRKRLAPPVWKTGILRSISPRARAWEVPATLCAVGERMGADGVTI
jgi:hypothetical protein